MNPFEKGKKPIKNLILAMLEYYELYKSKKLLLGAEAYSGWFCILSSWGEYILCIFRVMPH